MIWGLASRSPESGYPRGRWGRARRCLLVSLPRGRVWVGAWGLPRSPAEGQPSFGNVLRGVRAWLGAAALPAPPPSFGGRRRLGPERSLLASGRERGTLGAGPRPPLRCARHFPSLSGVPADRFGCFRDSSALGRQFPCWGAPRCQG